jgi:hypothetical protein
MAVSRLGATMSVMYDTCDRDFSLVMTFCDWTPFTHASAIRPASVGSKSQRGPQYDGSPRTFTEALEATTPTWMSLYVGRRSKKAMNTSGTTLLSECLSYAPPQVDVKGRSKTGRTRETSRSSTICPWTVSTASRRDMMVLTSGTSHSIGAVGHLYTVSTGTRATEL